MLQGKRIAKWGERGTKVPRVFGFFGSVWLGGVEVPLASGILELARRPRTTTQPKTRGTFVPRSPQDPAEDSGDFCPPLAPRTPNSGALGTAHWHALCCRLGSFRPGG